MMVVLVVSQRSKPLSWQTILRIVLLISVAATKQKVQSYQQSPSRNNHYVQSSPSRSGFAHHRRQHEVTYPTENRYNNYRGGGSGSGTAAVRKSAKIRPVSTKLSSDSSAIDSSSSSSSSSAPSLGSITTSLIKSMLGTGVLALPGALAVASNYKSSLIPANVLMATLGLLSAYTFILYGRLVDSTQANTLGELWNNIYNDGNTVSGTDKSAIIVSIASFLFTFGIGVAYSLIIGDILTGFVSQFVSSSTSIALLSLRQLCILGVTFSTLLPLCNLESMASLAPFSIIGTIGSLLTSAFIVWRCPTWNNASPYINAAAITTKGAFNTYNRMMNGSPAPLVLVATGLVSLSAHFGVCDFYHLVKKSSSKSTSKASNNNKTNDSKIIMNNFFKVTSGAFTAVAMVNAITMIAGFLTFGGNSLGIVLNNYKSTDVYATISKLLVGVSVIGAYPIVMNACKSELLSVLGKTKTSRSTQVQTSTILLSIVTVLALVIKDAGFVISLIGAVMGSSIIYTFPSLLFLRRNGKNDSKLERNFCRFLVGFGIFSAIIGGTTSVLNTFFPKMLG
jgi:solute carrier family 38 (sodium-coupled neutral amino acid transporter), member 11